MGSSDDELTAAPPNAIGIARAAVAGSMRAAATMANARYRISSLPYVGSKLPPIEFGFQSAD